METLSASTISRPVPPQRHSEVSLHEVPQQLVARYEALFELMENLRYLDDIPALAQRVGRQWQLFANVGAFHLVIVSDNTYLQIDCSHGSAMVTTLDTLADWDVQLAGAQQPLLMQAAKAQRVAGIPSVLLGLQAAEILALAFRDKESVQGLLSTVASGAAFSPLDMELIRFFGGHLVQHISNILLRQKSTETLKRQATIDSLTGALNRPAILDALSAQLALAHRSGLPLSVLLTDVDFFATINDTYGHPVGDAVLRELVRRFGMQCRARESFGRYGGKEFLFVLYPCPADEAMQVGERIRRCIAETAFALGADGSLKLDVSVSLGVTSASGNQTLAAEELIQRADDALYLSKHQGRNRISLYAASQPDK